MLFEKALSSIGKENEELNERYEKGVAEYKKAKETYNKLPENQREKWLKENDWEAKDFADDVMGYDEELDNEKEIRYAFKGKKTARYINKKLDTPTLSFIRNELRKIYGPIDSAIADGIAIEKDNSIFVVDSGMEDGLIDFGVRQQIKIEDDKLRKERLEKINDRAASNGFSSSEISGRIKRSPDNGGRSSVQRELQKKLSDNTRKSENNESRISEKDATDRSRRLKFSLKDSDGNELSPEQQEYFKNSKIVDKYGNLLVVYHGSPNKFTEFSHSFMNTNGNAHGRGFYFTEDINYADGFKKDGGQLLKGYLNIQKPISETEVTISRANLIKLIKATCEAQAKEFIDEESYDNIEDALLDTWVSNYVDTYSAYSMDYVYRSVADSVLNSCENDADIRAELTNGGANVSMVLRLSREVIGYDGVIFDNGNGTHQFIAFESNQFKNIDNKTPTKDKDIRFSKSNDGLYQKKVADISKRKVYAKKEATEIINTVIGSIDIGNGYYVDVTTKKSVEDVINELWKVLNTNEAGKRVKASEDIADYLIDTLVRYRGIIVYQKLKVGLLCEPHLFVYLKVFVFRSIICNRNLSYRTNRRYLYINSKSKVTPQADNSNC